jgi:hypothetical protein
MSCIAVRFIGQAPSMPFLDSLTPFLCWSSLVLKVGLVTFVDASSISTFWCSGTAPEVTRASANLDIEDFTTPKYSDGELGREVYITS